MCKILSWYKYLNFIYVAKNFAVSEAILWDERVFEGTKLLVSYQDLIFSLLLAMF